jgi:hypothetical protein
MRAVAKTPAISASATKVGVMHGKMNFFVIIFDRLNFSKTKD